jgi:hypothetical protein
MRVCEDTSECIGRHWTLSKCNTAVVTKLLGVDHQEMMLLRVEKVKRRPKDTSGGAISFIECGMLQRLVDCFLNRCDGWPPGRGNALPLVLAKDELCKASLQRSVPREMNDSVAVVREEKRAPQLIDRCVGELCELNRIGSTTFRDRIPHHIHLVAEPQLALATSSTEVRMCEQYFHLTAPNKRQGWHIAQWKRLCPRSHEASTQPIQWADQRPDRLTARTFRMLEEKSDT